MSDSVKTIQRRCQNPQYFTIQLILDMEVMMKFVNSAVALITQIVLVILIAGVIVLGALHVGGVILDSLSFKELDQSQVLLAIMYINLSLVLTYFLRGVEG